MKKIIALCAVAVVSMALAYTADAGRFGIKAGANLTSMNFDAGVPPALGYSAGITWQWNLPLGFAIQPDLLYHVKASRISDINSDTFGLGYLELPVNLQWGLRFAQRNVRLFAQASPFIGYAINQSGSLESAGTGNHSTSGIADWTNINRFSYGAGLGFGVQLWALQVTAQYTWNFGQLSNITNTSISDFNEKNFGGYVVSVALMFGKKKDKKD